VTHNFAASYSVLINFIPLIIPQKLLQSVTTSHPSVTWTHTVTYTTHGQWHK